MSDRVVYRKVPLAQRVCSYHRCHGLIKKNIARTKDGRLWHWGCLQSARDEQYQCLNCHSTFDATEATVQETQRFIGDSIKELLKISCPHCSSLNIRSAVRHHAMPNGDMVTCK